MPRERKERAYVTRDKMRKKEKKRKKKKKKKMRRKKAREKKERRYSRGLIYHSIDRVLRNWSRGFIVDTPKQY